MTDNRSLCPECSGTGETHEMQMGVRMPTRCETCRGLGYVIEADPEDTRLAAISATIPVTPLPMRDANGYRIKLCDFCEKVVSAWRKVREPGTTDGWLVECYPCAVKHHSSPFPKPDPCEFDEGDLPICAYGIEGCDADVAMEPENRCEQHNADYWSNLVDSAHDAAQW